MVARIVLQRQTRNQFYGLVVVGILLSSCTFSPKIAQIEDAQTPTLNSAVIFEQAVERAAAGDADAQFTVAEGYDYGNDIVSQDAAKAIALYRAAAAQNYAPALRRIGELYENGQFGASNNELARWYYTKAANRKDAKALEHLGRFYEIGITVATDINKALEYYNYAAALGNKTVTTLLAKVYLSEKSAAYNLRDIEKGMIWLTRSARQGSLAAQLDLAYRYRTGRDVAVDHELAIRWYRRALEQQSAAAMFRLAMYYREGRWLSKDYEKSTKLLESAAMLHSKPAAYQLGVAYEFGIGIAVNKVMALELYKQSQLEQALTDIDRIQRYSYCARKGLTIFFDHKIKCIDRETMQIYLGFLDVKVRSQDMNNWGDMYYSFSFWPGSNELNILYTYNNQFSQFELTFRNIQNLQYRGLYTNIAEQLGQTIDNQQLLAGNLFDYDRDYRWETIDQVKVDIVRTRNGKDARLTVTALDNFRLMQTKRNEDIKIRRQQFLEFVQFKLDILETIGGEDDSNDTPVPTRVDIATDTPSAEVIATEGKGIQPLDNVAGKDTQNTQDDAQHIQP